MDYEIKIAESKKYLIVKVFVDLTADIAKTTVFESNIVGMETRIDRLLFDVRGSRNVEEIKSNFKFATETFAKPEEHWFKQVANLTDPHDHSHSSAIAFMIAKGYNVKEFFIEKDAIDWLENGYTHSSSSKTEYNIVKDS